MKNQKGITLIALIITIIVLLILAGVSISLVVGQNGVLTNAQDAVKINKREAVLEAAQLAYNAGMLEKYSNKQNTETIQNLTMAELVKQGYDVKTVSTTTTTVSEVNLSAESLNLQKGEADTVINITYQTGNDSNSRYFVKIENEYYELIIGKEVTLAEETTDIESLETIITTQTEVSSSDTTETIIKVVSIGDTITVTPVGAGTATITVKNGSVSKTCTVTVIEPTPTYLVDKVEIGDYVNIDIDYENKQSFSFNSYVTTTSALTGWRVLSTEGTGATGTVKLVSAGCPLTYYHSSGDSSVSIPNLENLNKELTIVTSGTGFRANGLKLNGTVENNLSTIFTADKYIDTSKGVHALGCSTNYIDGTGTKATAYTPLNEIEEAYATITGTSKTMTVLYNMSYALGTTTLTSAAGDNWKSNYTDLLANGQKCWLGGASYSTDSLWFVGDYGYVGSNDNDLTYGVRPVVSLQSGVKLDSSNTGDGTSSNTAYTITK